jgi:hypothetical protein
MATDAPIQDTVKNNYCVVLRCSTRLCAPREGWMKLPPVQTDDGPMEFLVMSEFYEIDPTHSMPHHLILQTTIQAGSLKEANLNAQAAACLLVPLIAFANNAYIESPALWFSFEARVTDDWRRIGKIEFETQQPLITQRIRLLNPSTTQQFIAKFCQGREHEDANRFHHAIAFYVRALENWQMMTAIFAAHYLFVAAEWLTPIAAREYVAKQGKSEAELLEQLLKQRIPAAPKGATPEVDAAIAEIVRRMKGPAKRAARNDLNGEVRRNTIFRDSPDAYRDLRKATDGLEHGHHDVDETYAFVLPHMDKAPACIRKWIIDQNISDEALRAELLSGESRLPLIVGKFSSMVSAEFRCSDQFPTPAANRPPFRITPNLRDLEKPEVISLMRPDIELRSVKPSLSIPADTFAEEAKIRAANLAKFFRYKPKDLT